MTHFPDHPHDGETVAEEIGPDQARIWTYNEAKNEWTYKDYGPGGQLVFTDQVLVRDNQEVPGLKLDDPSTLMTQKEVNYWLDEKAGQGGGGGTIGKETQAVVTDQSVDSGIQGALRGARRTFINLGGIATRTAHTHGSTRST